jgi:16S rRNA (cytosine967-C5)-methyltransferase
MAQLSARRAALAALRTWRTETRFANSIIAKLLAETKLSTSDRAFALELFYGVLRNLTLLDFWVDCLRPAPIDVDLRDLLRLGIYQLFCLETPEHAAVYETVELARKSGRSVINGVLRTAARQQNELRSRAKAQPLFVRASHPQFLVARWEQKFGAKAAEVLCAWNNKPPPVYGRINRLKIDREEFLRQYPNSTPVAHDSDFVEFHTFPTNALNRGHCYIQDPSTVISCRLLDPQPVEKILDACAAPGGKTAYIAQLMKNRGVIVACDCEPDRVSILEENIAQLGVEIAQSFRCDWEHAPIPDEIVSVAPFDRILVDAPCTNSGVMRRRVDVRWRLQPADFVHMQKRQLEIIHAVFPLLKAGGVLVYSTCSLEPEENEEVVRRALAHLSVLRLEEGKYSLPFRDGFDGAFAAKLIRSA